MLTVECPTSNTTQQWKKHGHKYKQHDRVKKYYIKSKQMNLSSTYYSKPFIHNYRLGKHTDGDRDQMSVAVVWGLPRKGQKEWSNLPWGKSKTDLWQS